MGFVYFAALDDGAEHVTIRTPSHEHVGATFGRLTVLSVRPRDGRAMALCRCECGRFARTQMHNLIAGATRSCGCITVNRMTIAGRAGLFATTQHRRARFVAGLQREVIEARIAGDMERAREAEMFLESMGAEVPE